MSDHLSIEILGVVRGTADGATAVAVLAVLTLVAIMSALPARRLRRLRKLMSRISKSVWLADQRRNPVSRFE